MSAQLLIRYRHPVQQIPQSGSIFLASLSVITHSDDWKSVQDRHRQCMDQTDWSTDLDHIFPPPDSNIRVDATSPALCLSIGPKPTRNLWLAGIPSVVLGAFFFAGTMYFDPNPFGSDPYRTLMTIVCCLILFYFVPVIGQSIVTQDGTTDIPSAERLILHDHCLVWDFGNPNARIVVDAKITRWRHVSISTRLSSSTRSMVEAGNSGKKNSLVFSPGDLATLSFRSDQAGQNDRKRLLVNQGDELYELGIDTDSNGREWLYRILVAHYGLTETRGR